MDHIRVIRPFVPFVIKSHKTLAPLAGSLSHQEVRMAVHRFEAVLKRPEGVGTWTYLDIPCDVMAAFGAKGQVKVKGTVGGCAFRSSARPHGDGTHYLVVNQGIREAIGAAQGDRVQVELEPDTDPRVVAVPADLAEALAADAQAQEQFARLPYSHQKELVDFLESAKRPETRQKRVPQVVEAAKAKAHVKRR
jgi:hypothetical protein